jgi:hypothetical protein
MAWTEQRVIDVVHGGRQRKITRLIKPEGVELGMRYVYKRARLYWRHSALHPVPPERWADLSHVQHVVVMAADGSIDWIGDPPMTGPWLPDAMQMGLRARAAPELAPSTLPPR